VNRSDINPGHWTKLIVAAILATHTGLLAHISVTYSPTLDEVGHLAAGLYVLESGRFDVYRVNPPLVRTLAALPVWLAGPEYDWTYYDNRIASRPEWSLGRAFIQANGSHAYRYFAWARWAVIPLSLLGGFVCFCWARDLYGNAAGLTTLTLWSFSPNVLTWGSLITPDMGATSFGILAAYTFWKWLRQPTCGRAVVASAAFGLAELAKMTWVFLFVLWPVIWLLWRLTAPRQDSHRPWVRESGQLVVILVGGLYLLNLGYCFDGTLDRLGAHRFVSRTLTGENGYAAEGANRFSGTCLESIPVPLPRDYVRGMDLQKHDFEQGKWCYLRGEWRHGGWWYYYLYGTAIKEPIGMWCLVGLACIGACLARSRVATKRDEIVLLLPGILLFALVSSQTGFTRYLRYVLPAFAFVWIWAGQAARLSQVVNRRWFVPVCGSLLLAVGSCLSVYPHTLPYFNLLAGGPARGHEHLIDANLDWGQCLFDLKDWLDQHPRVRPVGVACRSFVPLDTLGLEVSEVPPGPTQRLTDAERTALSIEQALAFGPRPGWYVVSLHEVHQRSDRYKYFLQFEPVDRIAGALNVYRLTKHQVNPVRKALNLPELP